MATTVEGQILKKEDNTRIGRGIYETSDTPFSRIIINCYIPFRTDSGDEKNRVKSLIFPGEIAQVPLSPLH